MRRFIFFVFLAMCQSPVFMTIQAQEVFVTGIILDAEKGDPVSGASVQLKGGRVTAVSDSRGAFRIRASKGAILQVTSIGYGATQVTVGDALELQIRLAPSSSALNEVVVVGYGEQKAPTVTGAVGVISGKSLVQTPVANVTQMLVGTNGWHQFGSK